MGEQIKAITSLALGGEKALIGFIGKFVPIGLAALAGIAGLKGIADSLNNINRATQTLGVPAANIKNIADQLARYGISTQEATQLVAGLTKASVDLGRIGSPLYTELMNKAGMYSDAMKGVINQLTRCANRGRSNKRGDECRRVIRKNRHDKLIQDGRSEAEANRDAAQAQEQWFKVSACRPT